MCLATGMTFESGPCCAAAVPRSVSHVCAIAHSAMPIGIYRCQLLACAIDASLKIVARRVVSCFVGTAHRLNGAIANMFWGVHLKPRTYLNSSSLRSGLRKNSSMQEFRTSVRLEFSAQEFRSMLGSAYFGRLG